MADLILRGCKIPTVLRRTVVSLDRRKKISTDLNSGYYFLLCCEKISSKSATVSPKSL